MSGVRTFIGIPLPEDVLAPLTTACEAIRDLDESWRAEKWVPRANLHITLKFVGNVARDVLAALGDTVATVALTHHAFALPTAEIRAVPNPRRARMLWSTFLDPEGECASLAESLSRACLAFGAEPDERTFKPHVTLVRARLPKPLSGAALDAAASGAASLPELVSVALITLFASELTPRGPIYSVLRECPLSMA